MRGWIPKGIEVEEGDDAEEEEDGAHQYLADIVSPNAQATYPMTTLKGVDQTCQKCQYWELPSAYSASPSCTYHRII